LKTNSIYKQFLVCTSGNNFSYLHEDGFLKSGHLIIDSFGKGRYKLGAFHRFEAKKTKLKSIHSSRVEVFDNEMSFASDACARMVVKILKFS
jgi:hypothetical protein